MSDWQAFPAPAKLNLMLRLIGRRSDGYHLLQSVFQLLDWGDTVRLRVRGDGRILRHAGPVGVDDEADLSVRAARLLKAETGSTLGADIAVDKRIPMGGGFGGGSSDAATTLVVLNRLWGCGLDDDALAALGLRLGADVPVFVRGHSAWAEGVGERLTPMALPPLWFVLVDSGVHLATAELFQAPELTRNAPGLTMADFAFARIGDNAFTGPVRARAPRVAVILDAIAELGRGGLTGTGGGCYLATASQEAAREGARRLARFGRCEVVRGVDRSPLLAALAV